MRDWIGGLLRTPLSSIFPSQRAASSPQRHSYPILTIEEATVDGNSDDEVIQEEPRQEKSATTPKKKARVRPLSEQLLGRSRPLPSHEDDEGLIYFYVVEHPLVLVFFQLYFQSLTQLRMTLRCLSIPWIYKLRQARPT